MGNVHMVFVPFLVYPLASQLLASIPRPLRTTLAERGPYPDRQTAAQWSEQ